MKKLSNIALITLCSLTLLNSSDCNAKTAVNKTTNSYVLLNVGAGYVAHNTYDTERHNVREDYPYNFKREIPKVSLGVGRNITECFDVEVTVNHIGQFKHEYAGKIMLDDPQPSSILEYNSDTATLNTFHSVISGVAAGRATAYQKMRSTALLVNAKYLIPCAKFSPYLKAGVGVSWNTMGDYKRTVSKTFDVIYPGALKRNFAWNIGIGVQKQLWGVMERIKVGIGYDLQNIGTFQTKDIMKIHSNVNNTTTTYNQNDGVVGKVVGPKRNMIHSLYLSFTIDM